MIIHCLAKPEISRLKDEQGREDGTVLNRFVTIGGVVHSDRPWRTLAIDFDQPTCRVQIGPGGRYRVDRLTRHESDARRYMLTLCLDNDPPLRHVLTLAPAWATWAPAYDLVVQRAEPTPTATVAPSVDNELVVAYGLIRSDPPFRTLSVRLVELTHRLWLGPGGCYQIAKLKSATPAVQQLTMVLQIDEEQPISYPVDLTAAQPTQPFASDLLVPRPRAPETPTPAPVPEQPVTPKPKTTRKRAAAASTTKVASTIVEPTQTEPPKAAAAAKSRKRTNAQP